jgi:hypothetical protein
VSKRKRLLRLFLRQPKSNAERAATPPKRKLRLFLRGRPDPTTTFLAVLDRAYTTGPLLALSDGSDAIVVNKSGGCTSKLVGDNMSERAREKVLLPGEYTVGFITDAKKKVDIDIKFDINSSRQYGTFTLAAINPNGRPEHDATPREEDMLVEDARFEAARIRLAAAVAIEAVEETT